MSHARERRRAKRSGGKESGEEVLDFTLAATPSMLVLQREPAHSSEYLRVFFVIYLVLFFGT